MVVKVYISGISGNKEVKKRQQRVLMILDSKCIQYDVIDITEPGREPDKDFMQNNSKSKGGTVSDPDPRHPLPPQVFNDDEYCGDYDQFDLANEVDTLEQFLKIQSPSEESAIEQDKSETVLNGKHTSEDPDKEEAQEKVDEEGGTLEESPENAKSVEHESDLEDNKKESTPDLISEQPIRDNAFEKTEEDKAANGTTSSREQSVEKTKLSEVTTLESKKEVTDSEKLIDAEKSSD